jgi:hypothetical protein
LSDEILSFLADAERHPPTLQTWDTFGKRQDKLLTSEGWRGLQRIGIKEGIVAIPYVSLYGPYNRVYQFIKYFDPCTIVSSSLRGSSDITYGVLAPRMSFARPL